MREALSGKFICVRRSLYHHTSLISFSGNYFASSVSWIWFGYCNFILCFSVFTQGWFNCVLIVCFIFEDLLVSRCFFRHSYGLIHQFLSPQMKEKWNGSLHVHWVFGPYLLLFKESFTPSHPHTHCPSPHLSFMPPHAYTHFPYPLNHLSPPSHYILSSFYTSITHFPHYFPITPTIYHSFLTRLAPFPTCMTSKAHGHFHSLYILIPITLHITIPITPKMPHQLPHCSNLTHA